MKEKLEISNEINIEQIKSYIKENKLTIEEFCKKAGFGKGTYYRILKGSIYLGVDVVFKLARAMKIEVKDVFYKL